MCRILISTLFIIIGTVTAFAQGSVKGKVLDKQTDEVMEFVNVVVETPAGKLVKGAITDVGGQFFISGLKDGTYQLQVSFVGYKTLTRQFTISAKNRQQHYNALYISEDAKMLGEVQVTGQRSQMKLEVDRKVFSVDQILAAAGGSASDLLENIPSVEVTTDGEISLRGNSSVEVWINGKASGLTTDNRAEILQQIPAESIERIEVIDNPSAKYSPEGSAGIINIVLKRDRKEAIMVPCVLVPIFMEDGIPVVISITPVVSSMLLPTSVIAVVGTVGEVRVNSIINKPMSTRIMRVTTPTREEDFLPVWDSPGISPRMTTSLWVV